MSWWKQIWFALWCAGAVGCGDATTDSELLSSPKNAQDTFMVDARSTYLRQVFDRPRRPTVIALEDMGASAGDTLRLRRQGEFARTWFRSMTGNGMAAVFSASDALRSARYRRRVVDAIDAGTDVVTPRTFFLRKRTDIAEDFEITDSVDVTVPTGATHLLVTAIDDYFGDNQSQGFAVVVEVITDSNLCTGVDCDDGNECTQDDCNPLNGACDNAQVADGEPCDFGGLPGICGGSVCQDAMLCDGVDCDNSNECTEDSCDPLNGECGNAPVADGTDCDAGGSPGLCMGGACAPADLCADVDCDDSNECTDDVCDPANGQCGSAPVVDGTPCNFSGLPGLCMGGLCQDAMLCQGVVCDDGNQCTIDDCDPLDGQCGSTPVPDGTGCDFGGLPGICNGGACEDANLCQGVVCDDGNECTADLCDPQDGLCDNTAVPNDTPCDFGGLPGLCQGGVCQDAALCQGVDCDDSNQCTADACDPQDGVCDNTAVADDTPCDFGGLPGRCMSGFCEDAMLCQGVVCDDSNECTADLCDPQDGLCDNTAVSNDTPCEFGGLPGLCQGGVCQDAGLCQGIDCDDSNQCTADACDPQDGLCDNTAVADDTPCDFGGLPGRCMSGVCEDAMLCQGVVCDDANECTADLCDPQDGLCDNNAVPNDTPCDFGGFPGLCQGGVCQDAALCQGVDCDDTNQCTADACDPQDGLCDNTAVADDTPCDFGGLPGRCMSGVCEDAMLCQGVVCDDSNECTADLCDPQDGQCDFTPEPSGTACNAGGGPGSGTCDGAGGCNANPACGDGNLDPSEVCDDGNTSSGDGCAADCTWEPVSATFNVCCNINAPINVGFSDITVDATALPTTQVVAGQMATVNIDGTVDTSGIPVGVNATLVQPSTFTLGGVVGSSTSQTFVIPTPQAFNPGNDPILQLGMHQLVADVDPGGATQVCIDVTDTVVTATIFGSTNTYACTPGTCAGAVNTPVCVDASP